MTWTQLLKERPNAVGCLLIYRGQEYQECLKRNKDNVVVVLSHIEKGVECYSVSTGRKWFFDADRRRYKQRRKRCFDFKISGDVIEYIQTNVQDVWP